MFGFKRIALTHEVIGTALATALREQPEPTVGCFETRTRLSGDEVLRRAKAFFGPGGVGLALCREEPCWVMFEGGGGDVAVTVFGDEDGQGIPVEVVTKEWRPQAREFMRSLKR